MYVCMYVCMSLRVHVCVQYVYTTAIYTHVCTYELELYKHPDLHREGILGGTCRDLQHLNLDVILGTV